MAPEQHALLAPSSAHRWGNCPGSVNMELLFPEIVCDPEASREGTEAHELAEKYVLTLASTNGKLPDEPHPDAEMHNAAVLYAEWVWALMNKTGVYGGGHFGLEKRLQMPMIHPENWGTTDGYLYDHAHQVLHVWDLKYGYGPVEVEENLQLIDYAAGAVNEAGISSHVDHLVWVKFTIIQPRAFHRDGPIRTWAVKLSDLRGKFNKLANAATEALGPEPVCRSGEHCKHCSGRFACEAAWKSGMALYEAATAPMPLDASPEQLGQMLSIVAGAEARIKAIKEGLSTQIESMIRAGKQVPGWAMQPKRGVERWTVSEEEVIALGKDLGVELTKPKLLTPKQAREAGAPKEVVAELVTKTGGLELTPVSENQIEKAFK